MKIALAALVTVVALPLTSAPGLAKEVPEAPVFSDGQAQPVFDPNDVVRESLFVTAPVDSDRDGSPDRVHVEVVRPKATERGLRVPVVYQASPYFAGGNDVVNHDVDVELYVPGRPGKAGRGGVRHGTEGDERLTAALGPNPAITWRYEQYFTARGFAVVYAESLGSGQSTGCPTSGGHNETLGAKSVVDWLNGRAKAHDDNGAAVTAGWTTGKVGMMGVSYNGTLPNAVAATGVEGLEAIVPIAAISSWYDYYRADGAVVAPGGFQGEDVDVLAEYVYTRADQAVCKPVIAELAARQDRVTGDYSRFWDERNYVNNVRKVRAAVLAVHGLNDWNVKVKHVAQWYEALKRHHVPHRIWLHQAGHADPYTLRRDEWLRTLNRWFTKYLHGVDNGVDREPRATLQREDLSWVDEPEWPAPAARDTTLYPTPGGPARGGLVPDRPASGPPMTERLTDDATKTAEQLVDLARSANRLSYAGNPARVALRLSGTARVDLGVAFDRPAANVTALLVDRAPDGASRIITRGWTDPQNRVHPAVTVPVDPGRVYSVGVELEPKDYVLAAGHRLELVLLSSDHDYTLRPRPGAGLSVVLDATTLTLPAVGGPRAVREALGA